MQGAVCCSEASVTLTALRVLFHVLARSILSLRAQRRTSERFDQSSHKAARVVRSEIFDEEKMVCATKGVLYATFHDDDSRFRVSRNDWACPGEPVDAA